MRHGLIVNTGASVGDRQHDVTAWPRAKMFKYVGAIELDVRGFDGNFSAVGHCVAGVDDQIQNHLFDLTWIGFYCTQVVGSMRE